VQLKDRFREEIVTQEGSPLLKREAGSIHQTRRGGLCKMQANSGMVRYRVFVKEEGVQLRSRRCGSQERNNGGSRELAGPIRTQARLGQLRSLVLVFLKAKATRLRGERREVVEPVVLPIVGIKFFSREDANPRERDYPDLHLAGVGVSKWLKLAVDCPWREVVIDEASVAGRVVLSVNIPFLVD
jgi:hypothetical protein